MGKKSKSDKRVEMLTDLLESCTQVTAMIMGWEQGKFEQIVEKLNDAHPDRMALAAVAGKVIYDSMHADVDEIKADYAEALGIPEEDVLAKLTLASAIPLTFGLDMDVLLDGEDDDE